MDGWLQKNWQRLLWGAPVLITLVSRLQRSVVNQTAISGLFYSLLTLFLVGALFRGYLFFFGARYSQYYKENPFKAVFYMIGPAVLTLIINIGQIKPLLLQGVSRALFYAVVVLLWSIAVQRWSTKTGRREGYSLIATINSLIYTFSVIATVAFCIVTLILPLSTSIVIF